MRTRKDLQDEVVKYLTSHRSFEQNEVSEQDMIHFIGIFTDVAEAGFNLAVGQTCNYLESNIDQGLTIYHNQSWSKLSKFIEKYKTSMSINNERITDNDD